MKFARIAIAAIASCVPNCHGANRPAEIRPAQIIFIGESQKFGFDARSGDTVIVVMNPTGNILARCDHMGGELIYNPFTTIWTCEKVDF